MRKALPSVWGMLRCRTFGWETICILAHKCLPEVRFWKDKTVARIYKDRYYESLHLTMSSHEFFDTFICQKMEKALLIQMHMISENMSYVYTVISYHREVYEHQAQENWNRAVSLHLLQTHVFWLHTENQHMTYSEDTAYVNTCI